MVFSLFGRVEKRIVNSDGGLMDGAAIWALCGKKWRALLQSKS
jgi:hypothetical protein